MMGFLFLMFLLPTEAWEHLSQCSRAYSVVGVFGLDVGDPPPHRG